MHTRERKFMTPPWGIPWSSLWGAGNCFRFASLRRRASSVAAWAAASSAASSAATSMATSASTSSLVKPATALLWTVDKLMQNCEIKWGLHQQNSFLHSLSAEKKNLQCLTRAWWQLFWLSISIIKSRIFFLSCFLFRRATALNPLLKEQSSTSSLKVTESANASI